MVWIASTWLEMFYPGLKVPEMFKSDPEGKRRMCRTPVVYQPSPTDCRTKIRWATGQWIQELVADKQIQEVWAFLNHTWALVCVLKIIRVITAEVKRSGRGVFLVKDYLPSAEKDQCQAGPVPLQGLNMKRTPRSVSDMVRNSPQRHFSSAVAPRISPGPPGNARANTQAEDMS